MEVEGVTSAGLWFRIRSLLGGGLALTNYHQCFLLSWRFPGGFVALGQYVKLLVPSQRYVYGKETESFFSRRYD